MWTLGFSWHIAESHFTLLAETEIRRCEISTTAQIYKVRWVDIMTTFGDCKAFKRKELWNRSTSRDNKVVGDEESETGKKINL